jgi:hypothetical protein
VFRATSSGQFLHDGAISDLVLMAQADPFAWVLAIAVAIWAARACTRGRRRPGQVDHRRPISAGWARSWAGCCWLA